MWHDQGKWVTCRKFQFLFSYTTFSKLKNASFSCKPHYNWISGYRVMKDLKMLKQYKTKEFEHCFFQYLTNNTSDIRLILLDHVTYIFKKLSWTKIQVQIIQQIWPTCTCSRAVVGSHFLCRHVVIKRSPTSTCRHNHEKKKNGFSMHIHILFTPILIWQWFKKITFFQFFSNYFLTMQEWS